MSDPESDEDNIIRYGTPLDPYEEDEIPSKKKYQQQPDQYAVDAHGRRRFHGAFTGGFSAGYGNSVGTPEGWTPTMFKSSRTEKAQLSSQKPEDFMDEEDRSEHGIAPRHMQTHSEFSGQKRPRQQRYHDGPIPGEPVLEQVVRAVHETAAVRMLRAMGWKEGQGTGDRVTKQEKQRAEQQHKVYGCYMPPELRENQSKSDDDSTDSEFDYETLFAPDDYEPYILNRKKDRFGLGYSGLSRHSVLGNLVGEYGNEGGSKSHLVMREKGKNVSIRGQAFGVGAFEADDEDIYAKEDMSHYDFAIGGPANDKEKNKVKNKSNNVLEGFVKSTKAMPSVPSYPPPALPRDYTPAPAGARRSRFEPTTHQQRDQGLGRHELTAESRGALLGETPIPQPSTEKLPEDPIAKIVGRNIDFALSKPNAIEIKDMTQPNTNELDYISIKDSGKGLTKVFKPFSSDRQKQARYEMYLEDKNVVFEGGGDRLTDWERNRELAEFEQAAKLYKPLSGIMGERFTHASEPDEGAINPLCAVAKSASNYGLATKEQMEAATRSCYGVMTRKEAPWRPESLVCRRFNIPDPGADRPEAKNEDKPKVSYSIFSYLESSVHDKDSFIKEQSKFSGSKSLARDTLAQNQAKNDNVGRNIAKTHSEPSTSEISDFPKRITVAELFLKESEDALKSKEAEVTETIDKFDRMELYKSIFLSDSEEDEPKSIQDNTNVDVNDFIQIPKNIERNNSPPRGIFANIDFDELNSWKRTDLKENESKKTEEEKDKKIHNEEEIKDSNISEQYGPKIPENLMKRLEGTSDSKNDNVLEVDSSSSDSWVDMEKVKSKQSKKKKKKNKSKSKKSKHKKKDR